MSERSTNPYPERLTESQTKVNRLSARRRHGRAPVSMQINLTSMIDVIFLLLIYFVITANFTPDEGVLTAKMPQGTGTPEPSLKLPSRPLYIHLDPAGLTACRISVQNQPVGGSFTELARHLIALQHDPSRSRLGAYKPDDPVIIRSAGGVRWQHVVNAFNAAVKARYANVSFAQAVDQ